ncbi:MAG: hypothetical protein E5Y67_21575 [Mesorhizobium sp.]|nr:MAG: hypothetical protein E5Y67_21575 [Mesorhizobium sp.]
MPSTSTASRRRRSERGACSNARAIALGCPHRYIAFVILGRSKERSDAAQTPGSMPCPQSVTAVQNL